MNRKTRWIAIVGLSVTAAASMSVGVTSGGARGLVFGFALPVVFIFTVGFLTDVLLAMLAGLGAGVVGIALADRIGGDGSPDAINLLPLFTVLFLLTAAAVGMLCRLLSDYLRDRRQTHRPTAN